jgi:ribosome-associated toxin RatA of RatAB toxin-antitoxin module
VSSYYNLAVEYIRVSANIHLPRAEVYEALLDFARYEQYSEYLRSVRTLRGNGDVGTAYSLKFAWWKLSYAVESEVTATENPDYINWRTTNNLDARGRWIISPQGPHSDCDRDSLSKVTFEAEYDPHSANVGKINIPRFVSFDWVAAKIESAIADEAERVVERVVADLEGEPRPVNMNITTQRPSD